MTARRLGHSRNILHLEGQGTRSLGKHKPGFRSEQLFDIRPDSRSIIGCFHPETLQHGFTEAARRAVHGIRDQHMIPGRNKGKYGHGAGRKPEEVITEPAPCSSRVMASASA